MEPDDCAQHGKQGLQSSGFLCAIICAASSILSRQRRQVEFIKALTPQAGYPSWGATNVGPPAITTDVNVWMRIVKRNVDGEKHYTAYSSNDGVTWTHSGTWIHNAAVDGHHNEGRRRCRSGEIESRAGEVNRAIRGEIE